METNSLSIILIFLLFAPLVLQVTAMFFDEFYFHRRRGLPKWERIGHPLDTLSVIATLSIPIFFPFGSTAVATYAILVLFSSLMVTKDEFVHSQVSSPGENWLHSILFVMHPLVFLSVAGFWYLRDQNGTALFAASGEIILGQGILSVVFMFYQIFYWNFWRSPHSGRDITPENQINTEVYDQLGDDWYRATDDPIALLRAESRLTTPWIASQVFPASKILDVGCGAGFLSNALAKHGHEVTGFDLSEKSLEVAKAHDVTRTVKYIPGNAYALPFADASFDVICSMDFLEHIEDVPRVIAEISRVLKPGGKFFFHTFNRNLLSRLVAIHLVEFILRKTPKNLHLYRLFIKPSELNAICSQNRLKVTEWKGLRPKIESPSFFRSLLRFRVSDDFSFTFTPSLAISYVGKATK